jgi:hypothetical protein
VRCARAAHDDGEDVDIGLWPVVADGIGEGVYLARISWVMWERLWSMQYFHSPICIFLIEEYRRRPFV